MFFGDKKLGIYIGKFWVSSVNSTNLANFCYQKIGKKERRSPLFATKEFLKKMYPPPPPPPPQNT
jgi:hypothetical protein